MKTIISLSLMLISTISYAQEDYTKMEILRTPIYGEDTQQVKSAPSSYEQPTPNYHNHNHYDNYNNNTIQYMDRNGNRILIIPNNGQNIRYSTNQGNQFEYLNPNDPADVTQGIGTAIGYIMGAKNNPAPQHKFADEKELKALLDKYGK